MLILLFGMKKKSFHVTENIIEHKHKMTPYLNEELFGVVEKTYLSGENIFDKGAMVLNKGKFILH
jgi:allantoinase